MTVHSEIAVIDGLLVEGELENLIKRWAKCREVWIDDGGDVRVGNLRLDHWLSPTDLEAFVGWFKLQILSETQIYHEPVAPMTKVGKAVAA